MLIHIFFSDSVIGTTSPILSPIIETSFVVPGNKETNHSLLFTVECTCPVQWWMQAVFRSENGAKIHIWTEVGFVQKLSFPLTYVYRYLFLAARSNTYPQCLFMNVFSILWGVQWCTLETGWRNEGRMKDEAKKRNFTRQKVKQGESSPDSQQQWKPHKCNSLASEYIFFRYHKKRVLNSNPKGQTQQLLSLWTQFPGWEKWLTVCIYSVREPATPMLTKAEIKEQRELNYTLAKTSGIRRGKEAWWMRNGSEQKGRG